MKNAFEIAHKSDGRKKHKAEPSEEFIGVICSLYKDVYDDRLEDSKPQGKDWVPRGKAKHQSLVAFQRELKENGFDLSTAKIRKILITGGKWTTERSRAVAKMYEKYKSIPQVAKALGVTDELVTMYLPYGKVVYDLENKSGNARRIERCKAKKRKVIMDERIRRIRLMESKLNKVQSWIRGLKEEDIRDDILVLESYYRSSDWISDFEADEKGELPADLLRGVLSENGIYNALLAYEEHMRENGNACE